MKILQMNGNYTNGTRIVQYDNGMVEKQTLFIKNGNPTCTIDKVWDTFDKYLEDNKSKPIDMDKVFKNW